MQQSHRALHSHTLSCLWSFGGLGRYANSPDSRLKRYAPTCLVEKAVWQRHAVETRVDHVPPRIGTPVSKPAGSGAPAGESARGPPARSDANASSGARCSPGCNLARGRSILLHTSLRRAPPAWVPHATVGRQRGEEELAPRSDRAAGENLGSSPASTLSSCLHRHRHQPGVEANTLQSQLISLQENRNVASIGPRRAHEQWLMHNGEAVRSRSASSIAVHAQRAARSSAPGL